MRSPQGGFWATVAGGLAEVTVKMHVSSIFRELGVASRTQAVRALRRLGLETVSAPNVERTLK